jgi:hypothetical protein
MDELMEALSREPRWCFRCGLEWVRPAVWVSCAVVHPPGACCHHGERLVTQAVTVGGGIWTVVYPDKP